MQYGYGTCALNLEGFVHSTDPLPCGRLLLRCAQRLAWASAMHSRLGGGRDKHNSGALDMSPVHMLSFDLVSMVISMLPMSLDYALVRRHGQEQRQLVRGARGPLRRSTRSCGGTVSHADGTHGSQAVSVRKSNRRQAGSDSGGIETMRDSKSRPRRRRPRKPTDDTGITLADMHKAQTAAVAAAAAGEVVRAYLTHETYPLERSGLLIFCFCNSFLDTQLVERGERTRRLLRYFLHE